MPNDVMKLLAQAQEEEIQAQADAAKRQLRISASLRAAFDDEKERQFDEQMQSRLSQPGQSAAQRPNRLAELIQGMEAQPLDFTSPLGQGSPRSIIDAAATQGIGPTVSGGAAVQQQLKGGGAGAAPDTLTTTQTTTGQDVVFNQQGQPAAIPRTTTQTTTSPNVVTASQQAQLAQAQQARMADLTLNLIESGVDPKQATGVARALLTGDNDALQAASGSFEKMQQARAEKIRQEGKLLDLRIKDAELSIEQKQRALNQVAQQPWDQLFGLSGTGGAAPGKMSSLTPKQIQDAAAEILEQGFEEGANPARWNDLVAEQARRGQVMYVRKDKDNVFGGDVVDSVPANKLVNSIILAKVDKATYLSKHPNVTSEQFDAERRKAVKTLREIGFGANGQKDLPANAPQYEGALRYAEYQMALGGLPTTADDPRPTGPQSLEERIEAIRSNAQQKSEQRGQAIREQFAAQEAQENLAAEEQLLAEEQARADAGQPPLAGSPRARLERIKAERRRKRQALLARTQGGR